MKNVPFFQLFTLIALLIFSIENYRDFMFRKDNSGAQAEPSELLLSSAKGATKD